MVHPSNLGDAPSKLSLRERIELAAGPQVDVFVGPKGPDDPKQTHWVFPKNLLCKCSKYFEKSLNGPWIESQTQSCDLDEDKPEYFEILLEYMWAGEVSEDRFKPRWMIEREREDDEDDEVVEAGGNEEVHEEKDEDEDEDEDEDDDDEDEGEEVEEEPHSKDWGWGPGFTGPALEMKLQTVQECMDFIDYADKYDLKGAAVATVGILERVFKLDSDLQKRIEYWQRAKRWRYVGKANEELQPFWKPPKFDAFHAVEGWVKKKHVEFFFEKFPAGSPFRTFMAEVVVSHWGPDKLGQFKKLEANTSGYAQEQLSQLRKAKLCREEWTDPLTGIERYGAPKVRCDDFVDEYVYGQNS